MVVVRIIVKIVLLPVRICLTMIQLVVMFFTWLSATVFHILSGIIYYSSFRVWIRTGDRHRSGQDACGRFYTLYPAVLSGWAVVWLETIKIRLMK